jgi:hypothetical protein
MVEPYGWWGPAYHAPSKPFGGDGHVTQPYGTNLTYMRDGSGAGRTPGPISSSDDQLRTELDLHAMAPNRGHHFGHTLEPERGKQARR